VRVPDEAGDGPAKVTISFNNWMDGNIARSTFELAVVEPKPKQKAD
jgi:hypothetical protein